MIFSIPADINSRDRLRTAEFYHRDLGWAIHALCPPNSGQDQERGKKPIARGWRSHMASDVTPDYLHKHFNNGAKFNLGVVVHHPFVHVDLDSKPDGGISVQGWLTAQPQLGKVPRERTAGGAHLVFTCHDLPETVTKAKKAITAHLNEGVTGELYTDGMNLVLSPSVHKSGKQYAWEITGEIPEVSWAQLRKWFGFEEPVTAKPGRPAKEKPWWARFKGDLRSLDLAALFREAGMLGACLDTETCKWSVRCPWAQEHSNGSADWNFAGSDTAIFGTDNFPVFKCLHAHCASRGLAMVCEFFEARQPGSVDAHCAQLRAWQDRKQAPGERPQILLPAIGRADSEFASDIGEHIGSTKEWFRNGEFIVRVEDQPDIDDVHPIAGVVLRPMTAVEVITEIERYVEVGIVKKDAAGDEVFQATSLNEQKARALLASSQFRKGLPFIRRILDVPIPILHDGEIARPVAGYDERFQTYLYPSAPVIVPMGVDEARHWILEEVLSTHERGGFCWKDDQSRIHAIARLLTPLCRGLMQFARPPLWIFEANRERCGKDYCAQCPSIVFLGRRMVSAPLEKDSNEEMRKRITAALAAGARMMHFANMKGHIRFSALEAATDNSGVWEDRILGLTKSVTFRNEVEFSLSANAGTTWEPDIEARSRRIALHFTPEDVNNRRFRHEDLHGFLMRHRSPILNALMAFVTEWERLGRPDGPTPFSSFPQWAKVVGGIMTACGLGDPCLPHADRSNITGDQNTEQMKKLFVLANNAFGEAFVEKKAIYELVDNNQDADLFGWIDLSERGGQTRFAMLLRKYDRRELGGITLHVDERSGGRSRFQFARSSGVNPVNVVNLQNRDACAKDNSGADQEANEVRDSLGHVLTARNEVHEVHTVHTIAYRPILDRMALESIAAAVLSSGSVALDIETFGPGKKGGLDPWRGEIRLLSLCVDGHEPWLLDLQAIGYDLGPLGTALAEVEVIGHNLKFDALWLLVKCRVKLPQVFCTLTAARLLVAGTRPGNDLDHCLQRYLGIAAGDDQSRSDWADMLLTDDQLAYAVRDVRHLHALKAKLIDETSKAKLDAAAELEMRLLPVVVAMEAAGMAVDRTKLGAIRDRALTESAAREAELREALNAPALNVSSPQQLQPALQQAGINVINTSEETLKESADTRFVPLILAYRAAKGRALQANTLIESISADGRIHGRFEPMGTVTGRFSSKEPNLQNIGRGPLRDCFVAPEGTKLVVADYSQIELRAAAAIAGETKMIEAYRRGEDLHKATAAAVLGKDLEAVTKQDRQLAKAVNFGLLYGQCPAGLVKYAASSYGVTLTEDSAKQIRKKFFDTYSGLRQWHSRSWRQAEKNVSEVRTCLGRRRLIPQEATKWNRFTALVNSPVQGGCADGMKRALVQLTSALPASARIVSTVHDELIVEVPEDEAEDICRTVETVMVAAFASLFPQVPEQGRQRRICKGGEAAVTAASKIWRHPARHEKSDQSLSFHE